MKPKHIAKNLSNRSKINKTHMQSQLFDTDHLLDEVIDLTEENKEVEIIPSENKRNIDISATHEIKSFNRFGFSGSRRNIKANTLTNEELKQEIKKGNREELKLLKTSSESEKNNDQFYK